MAIFFIAFNDLDMIMQSTIQESLKMEIIEELEDEAKQRGMDFTKFMTHKRYYGLNQDNFDIEFENLLVELVDQRIKRNFISLPINL